MVSNRNRVAWPSLTCRLLHPWQHAGQPRHADPMPSHAKRLLSRKDRVRRSPRLCIPLGRRPLWLCAALPALPALFTLPGQRLRRRREPEAAQPLEHAARLVDLRADGDRLGARAVEVVLHQLNGRLARLVRAVLVEDVVHVDEERAQVLRLGRRGRGAARQRARQLEEVEEQRLGQLLELKGAVVVLGVLGGRGPRGGEVGDALLLERGELVVELRRRR